VALNGLGTGREASFAESGLAEKRRVGRSVGPGLRRTMTSKSYRDEQELPEHPDHARFWCEAADSASSSRRAYVVGGDTGKTFRQQRLGSGWRHRKRALLINALSNPQLTERVG
jgi:hypothetical protein